MYTQCPHCDAIFQLSTAQLKAANGEVRCGQCLAVFNALNHLSDEIPAPTDQTTTSAENDAELNNPWADDKLAESGANTAPDMTPETTPETTDDVNTDTAEKTADADIFSEVIAEANQSSPATEAIDRFEEFLDADTQPVADFDVGNDIDTNDEQPTEVKDPANESDALTAIDTEMSEDAPAHEEPLIEATDAVSEETPNNIESSNDFKEVAFGDTEDVTADLDAEIHIDATDESSEFHEHMPAADSWQGKQNGEAIASLSTEPDTTEIKDAVSIEADIDADVDSHQDPAPSTDDKADSENEDIIIEEADLEPITSSVYDDILGVSAKDSVEKGSVVKGAIAKKYARDETAEVTDSSVDDFSDIEAAAAEAATSEPDTEPQTTATEKPVDESQQTNSAETLNIPQLIMDDLHAAKAEQMRPSNTPWVVGCLVLMLALTLQVVYHSRNDLAKDTNLRPWMIQMCQLTNCTLSQPYDIKQIDIIGREVRSHPSAKKALIASTTLINNAGFVQPYPLLTVVFSDINGKPLAQRRFAPREYLGNNVDLAAGMTPDMPVRIELELIDPGKAAVNYEFHAELDPRNTRPLT